MRSYDTPREQGHLPWCHHVRRAMTMWHLSRFHHGCSATTRAREWVYLSQCHHACLPCSHTNGRTYHSGTKCAALRHACVNRCAYLGAALIERNAVTARVRLFHVCSAMVCAQCYGTRARMKGFYLPIYLSIYLSIYVRSVTLPRNLHLPCELAADAAQSWPHLAKVLRLPRFSAPQLAKVPRLPQNLYLTWRKRRACHGICI